MKTEIPLQIHKIKNVSTLTQDKKIVKKIDLKQTSPIPKNTNIRR